MTLSHRQAQEFIDRQLDGPLTPGVQQALSKHLEACADCYDYAREAIQLDAKLVETLPALWPARQASTATLAATLGRIEEAQGKRLRRRFPTQALTTVFGLLLILLFSSLFLEHLASTDQPVEEAAFNDTFPGIDEASAGLVNVHFELDGRELPGEGIDLYYPLCDGIEYYPPAGSLAQKLELGEPLPDCKLQPSRTILLAPGESRDVLLVYRNPANVPVTFRIVPTSRTELAVPFSTQLCGARSAGDDLASTNCAVRSAPAWGIWAEFITFEAPVTAEPGAHVTITARVQRIEEDS
jgi:hypothetical protein